ncbi:negative regulator of the PHO system [Sporothrix stenoceras]|uniref:Negative regulator of the PHO system n=1 Tax=Sporothrix stenoceras TaxID=5173 RepID=A0ABR3Z264_9PEZI
MDHDRERDRLVAALRHKLSELDARVVAYRRERADEFRRYAVDLLTPAADEAVVAAVAEAIEGKPDPKINLASKTDGKVAQTYPALFAGFLDNAGDDTGNHNRSILAPPPHARTLPRRTASPPPVLYHTSGVPKEGPRRPPTNNNAPEASPSLHARDDDFRGVFTPPFLPLLDSWSYDRRTSDTNTSSNKNDTSASDAATAAATVALDAATAKADAAEAAATKAAAENEAAETKAAETAAAEAEAAAAAAATPPPPPEPKLKSALRRTSSYSSSRSSTRSNTPTFNSPAANTSRPANTHHVRFSFNGEEVLPTASPPREHEQDLSWLMHDDRSNHSGGHSNIYDYSRHYHNATAGSGAFSSSGLDSSSSAHGNNLALGATALSAGPLSHSSLPGNEAEVGTAGPSSNSTSAAASTSTESAAGDQTTPLSQPSKNQPRNESHSTGDTFSSSSNPTSSTSNSHQTPPRPPQPRRRHSQILDDDEDEFVPLSRKVSSSDRLRALSKMPLEDPSMWTVVNPQADAAAAAAGNNTNDSAGSSAPTSNTDLAAATAVNRDNLVYQPSPAETSSSYRAQAPSPPTVEQREYADGNSYNSDASSDDDGFIAMRPSRGKSPISTAPAASTTPTTSTTPATTSATTTNGTASDGNSSRPKQSTSSDKVQVTYANTNGSSGRKKAAAAEDDDFFGFEADDMDGEDVGYPLSRVTDVNTHFDDDDDDVDIQDEDVDDEEANGDDGLVDDKDLVKKEKAALGIGTDGLDSMDLVINRHKPIVNNREGESALSSSLRRDGQLDGAGDEQPSSPGPASISVGSYRGKPIDLFNVVKDPRILQQAAQMGTLNSFVGSIHDHETYAPANMAEFSSLSGREQLNLLSGTPRSLTERMVMEDTRAFFSPSKR